MTAGQATSFVTALLSALLLAAMLECRQPTTSAVQSDIYIMSVDGTDVRNLTNHPAPDQEPEFSPDGTRLLFDSERNGNADIFVMNVDGTGLVQITAGPAKEDHVV